MLKKRQSLWKSEYMHYLIPSFLRRMMSWFWAVSWIQPIWRCHECRQPRLFPHTWASPSYLFFSHVYLGNKENAENAALYVIGTHAAGTSFSLDKMEYFCVQYVKYFIEGLPHDLRAHHQLRGQCILWAPISLCSNYVCMCVYIYTHVCMYTLTEHIISFAANVSCQHRNLRV